MRRRAAPFWFHLLLTVSITVALRALASGDSQADGVQLAFWGWFIVVAEVIWTGIQAVGHASLITLTWFVNTLVVIVRTLGNALWAFGKVIEKGLLETWQFFRRTFDVILKPAWLKFWRFVVWAKNTLDDFFRPIFKFLRHLRDELLGFYTKWVRPILDSIGIARHVLTVFKALGFEWARQLDAKLAALEAAIDRPFRLLLAKLNEVMNFVNRIATADGLFQRLALVRSIERDIRYVSRAFMNWRSVPITEAAIEERRRQSHVRTIADVRRDTEEVLSTGSGRYAPIIDEMKAQWLIYLKHP